MGGGKHSSKDNLKRLFSPFGLALLALSTVYIGAEALFNMKLVEVAGSVKSNPDDIRSLQHFGRAVSGYGFSLLTIGVFATFGFQLKDKRHWALFGMLAAFSFIPFLMEFADAIFGVINNTTAPQNDEPWDAQISMLPFLGFAAVLLSAGKFRVHLIVGLVLMAWPAMFLGQKLLIERYLIDRTTWETRQDARYILMLRGGLEDCKLDVGGLQFCDASRGEASMKSARIVISSLWMLAPDKVLNDLKARKDEIVQKAAASGTWFSSKDLYAKYVRKVSDTRGKYLDEVDRKYYQPYLKASEIYKQAADPASAKAEADKAVAEVEAGIDQGWKTYQDGVHDYKQSASVIADVSLQQMLPYAGRVNAYCSGGNCPNVDIRKTMAEAKDRAEREFYNRTGYHSDIPDRATFAAQPPTQERIRKSVEPMIQQRFNMPSFTLPKDWKYDPATFGKSIADMISSRAGAAWKARFGDKLQPGLDEDKFLAAAGVGNIPTTAELIMSEDDFYKKVVLPGNQKIVDEMMAELNKDRDKYPPWESGMDEGKDYVEAVYIPAISLVISLSVVVLTLLRGFMAFMDLVLLSGKKKIEKRWLYIGRAAVAAMFISMLLALPRLFPNPYASGSAYDRYYADAKAKHPYIASVLNWSVQVQPIIYRLGRDIRRATTWSRS